MQASVALCVPVEHVAVELHQHFQRVLLVVAQTTEQGCVALVVHCFYYILVDSELAKHHCELSVSVSDSMMQCIPTALILNCKRAFASCVNLQEGYISQHGCLN